MPPRFLPVGLTAMLVELPDLDETLALFASLASRPIPGIEEVVPAARTLLVRFRPDIVAAEALAAEIAARDRTGRTGMPGPTVEVPVHYAGEDLEEVARLLGIGPDEVVRRHTARDWTVAFTGFAPGFGYLVGGDPTLQVPRRRVPRTRIPAGAVALAGAFSGIYPRASPGGWQIIGATPLVLWDLARRPPALLQPGTRVRFVDAGPPRAAAPRSAAPASPPAAAPAVPPLGLHVLAAPLPALVQDLGRPGQAGQGVSRSGALDRGALRVANRAVGNPPNTPCLEIAGGGFRFEALGRLVVALAGAPCPIVVRGRDGRRAAEPGYRALALEPGDTVELGHPAAGTRAYLAVRGGFAVEPVLDSAATDTLAGLGPEPVGAGATVAVHAGRRLAGVSLSEGPPGDLPAAGDAVTLDVVMGPRADWFTPAGIARLCGQDWTVTPQSDRVGLRLAGDAPLERRDAAELPSEGTATGAIQVPHSGQPVLFLADHPLTGGYPVIATVAEHHLDLAAQVPVGARIRFRPVAPFAEIAPSALPIAEARP